MNRAQLLAIAPVGACADTFLAPLNAAMARCARTPAARGSFLAQCLHESMMLTRMTENLNYSPAGLMATFNTRTKIRFTPEMAARYGRVEGRAANQQMIANIAYANRMGNGSVESGDGWRYRGRGPIQITGAVNYRAFGLYLGIDMLASPDRVAQPETGCMAAAWYWERGNPTGRSLSLLADAGRFDDVSRAVNGGSKGLEERRKLTIAAIKELS